MESADALSGSGAPSALSAPSGVTSGYCIEAKVFGEEFDQERHGLKVEVKTPTYHEYRIEKTEDGYRATVILDV